MAKTWKPSRAPAAPQSPVMITSLARTYHACALALSRSLGLPMSETFVLQFHNAISSIFIASDRAGVRLPAAVTLPTLAVPEPQANGHQGAPAESNTNSGNTFGAVDPERRQAPAGVTANGDDDPDDDPHDDHDDAIPTTIPVEAGLPCGGQGITTLKPAPLAMLLAKTTILSQAKGGAWTALAGALQAERARRLAQGRRPVRTPGEEG